MKRNKPHYGLIWFFSTAGLFFLAVIVVFVLDYGFNGLLREWLTGFLASQWGGVDWQRVYVTGMALVFLVCLLLTTVGVVCARTASRRQKERQILAVADYARELAETRDGELPRLNADYAALEAPLTAMKLEAERARRLAEAEMRRKSDLVTYLAHDLKTPLASVIAYLSLLDETPDLTAEQRARYTGVALEKAYRLEQLIGELFEIVRFDMQEIVLNKKRIRLRLMLEQLADEFYPLLLRQGKRICVTCDDALTLTGDPYKLARVFNNILKNAAAYSYENTQIDVCARAEDSAVALTFANQGDPIPEREREAIFEKFYRLDAARSTRSGGAGLGLAIAREIVEAHGGTVGVQSGVEGTVFTVRLPQEQSAFLPGGAS